MVTSFHCPSHSDLYLIPVTTPQQVLNPPQTGGRLGNNEGSRSNILFLAVFRGFWTLLIILGLAAALTGGFVLVCGVPFISRKLCRLGGTLLIAAGKLFAVLLRSVCACKHARVIETAFSCSHQSQHSSRCRSSALLL